MIQNIHKSWEYFFQNESNKSYFKDLISILNNEYDNYQILPEKELIFKVFQLPITDIKVIIIGQDPYPTPGHANGIAFSVNENIKLPKSLNNIFKEVKKDYPNFNKLNGDLSDWLNSGIFLINTILSIRSNEILSHKGIGWEIFTENLLDYIKNNTSNIVFMLWGKNAHKFETKIGEGNYIIKTSHPSPLGYSKKGLDFKSFKDSGQFKEANDFLKSVNKNEIIW